MIEQLIERGNRTLVSTSFSGMLILEHTDPKIRRHWLNRALLIAALAKVNVGSKGACLECRISDDGKTMAYRVFDPHKLLEQGERLLKDLEKP